MCRSTRGEAAAVMVRLVMELSLLFQVDTSLKPQDAEYRADYLASASVLSFSVNSKKRRDRSCHAVTRGGFCRERRRFT